MPSVSFRGRRAAAASAALGLAVAAAAAGVFREDLCVPYYLRQLNAKDESDRLNAAKRLGEIRSTWAVPRLVGLLRIQRFESPQAKVYGEALERIGPPAIPALLEAMPEEKGREKAAVDSVLWPLGQRNIPRVGQSLEHPDPRVRRIAAKILASLDPPQAEAVPFLLRALEDPDMDVCWEAAFNLENFPLGGDAIQPLAGALRRNDQDVLSRAHAARALAKIGGAAFPWVLDALQDDNAEVRAAAAESLGHFGAPFRDRVLPLLVKALDD